MDLGALSLHSSLFSDTMLSKLQPPQPPQALPSVSFTQYYCYALFCFSFLHCGLDHVSRQKVGAIIGLIIFVSFILGTIVHAACCFIFGHRCVIYYA